MPIVTKVGIGTSRWKYHVRERHPVRQTRKALAILFAVEEEGRSSPGNEREAK